MTLAIIIALSTTNVSIMTIINNDSRQNDIQQNDIRLNDTQQNDNRQKDTPHD
jgi:hypothetical protein